MPDLRRCLLVAVMGLVATQSLAGPVALKEGKGQGLAFSHRGNCYVVFPDHVDPAALILNLFTAAPQAAGTATVYFRRPEADVALALVQGSAASQCDTGFADLPRDVSRYLGSARTAILERVDAQGAIERLAMRIDRVGWALSGAGHGGSYQYIYASIDAAAGETREVYQGTSGAFLYIDGTPVGMVVTAPDATSVRALRLEEITGPIARWFASGSFGGLPAIPEAAAAPEGLPFELTGWTGEVDADGPSPVALAQGVGAFRATPVGRPVSITVEVTEGAPVPLRALRLRGPAEGSTAAAPRLLRVEVDRSRSGPARFQEVWTGEMVQDGAEMEVPLVTFVRRLRITVLSSWEIGAVEISGLALLPPE